MSWIPEGRVNYVLRWCEKKLFYQVFFFFAFLMILSMRLVGCQCFYHPSNFCESDHLPLLLSFQLCCVGLSYNDFFLSSPKVIVLGVDGPLTLRSFCLHLLQGPSGPHGNPGEAGPPGPKVSRFCVFVGLQIAHTKQCGVQQRPQSPVNNESTLFLLWEASSAYLLHSLQF